MRRRTWQDNADTFRELDQGEGWPFARLVACSVERGAGQNERGSRHRDHDDEKVSANKFADRANTSADRVLRYLTLWEKAAGKGWVPETSGLTPEDWNQMTDPEHDWRELYDAKKAGGRPRDSRPDDAVTIVQRRGAEAVVAAMPDAVKAEVARELGKTDVGMDAALEGYAQRPEEKARRRTNKERQAAQGEERVTYHFSTKIVMAELLMLDGRIEEVTTENDGRDFEWTEEGANEAVMVAAALRSLADRLEAWAKRDERDAWDRGLAQLLGQDGDVA